ncbi:hypothetical protein [Methanosarcina sp. 2.H.A.1B.4]|uniref:hypothetical protein n=1 Tax=Methanosarcina sp. 2.H.A.1B.4 TaxID=1483600 RepID=UPI000621A2F9|nr:hypothetical protein [Methanosarcina sp. 2.H.A.1B.4]KKG11376.1 hypothetical protein EO92_10425 [Methanosarcina sp. 2.H.A.1B.4]
MFKKSNIVKWLMLTLFIYFLLSGSASADDSELNDSESNEISDSITEFANDPSFIAYRGTIPETIDQEWKNSIVDCWLNLNRIGPSYSEFDSSISSIAASDILIIELGSAYKEEVDDSRIDEMYQKIEDYCEEQESISEIPVVFMWAWDEADLPLPDYGPQIFEDAKKNPLCVATRGAMPVITDASEKVEWIDSLVQCKRALSNPSNTDTGITPYFVEFGGPVSSFGPNMNGYLNVGFEGYSSEKVNESLIDEIYQVIDESCEEKGISGVPVVFEFIGYITEDIAVVDGPSPDEADYSNLSGNEEEITGNETTNQMPGFTSIMVILGLLSVLVFKRS